MRHKITALITLVAMVMASAVMAAEGPDLTVQPVGCAAPSIHPRVIAKVPASAISGQVFFKAEGTTNEYYVDMRKAADGTMWAFLPGPAPSTKSFTYRVVTLDSAGKRASSQMMTLNTSPSCPTTTIPSNERAAETAIVVGLTSNSQPIVPTGFECKDIVSYITVSGEMRPNDECRRMMAGAVPGAAGAAESGFALSRGTIIALTAAGLAGAGVAIHKHKKDKNKSKSKP